MLDTISQLIPTNISFNNILEIVSAIFSLFFIYFLIKEKIYAWLFSLISSSISVYIFLFTEVKLYSQAILYGFYASIAIYGWWMWDASKESKIIVIHEIKFKYHILILSIGIILTLLLSNFWISFHEGKYVYFDSFIAVFSIIASIMEIYKVLSVWYYWLILNILNIFLFYYTGLNYYFIIYVLYTFISIYGLKVWNNEFKKSNSAQ